MRAVLMAAAALASCTPHPLPMADPAPPPPAMPGTEYPAAMRAALVQSRGNALWRVRALEELDRTDTRDTFAVRIEIMRALAEAGRVTEAHGVADRLLSKPVPPAGGDPPLALSGFAPRDAAAAVVEAAAGVRVLMLNEAHHVPQHRAFTVQLLAGLRRAGFTHFAAETLFATDTALAARGYPTAWSGAYIQEPLYGDLVRTALRLGFQVVAYESPGEPDERERGQAAHLAAVLRDPAARIVVHAGYGHIVKSAAPGAVPSMAMRLRELTEVAPLSVDQTTMTEHGAPEYEAPLFRASAARDGAATVFARGDGFWSASPASIDITVFHPRTRLVRGRPQWLRMGGLRRDHALPSGLCGPLCLVEARYAGEPAEAIPVDRFYVTPGERLPVLVLPPGEFRVTAEDADGSGRKELRVRIR